MAEDRKKIVIIEDEPDTVEMFAEMMRLNGFKVLKSYGGALAVALIAEEKPDVVVLDMMMPDLPGLDVMSQIRDNPELANIPVIIVSAMSMPQDIQAGMDAGAAAYLTKPVTYQQLSMAVEKTLQAAG
ncbi:MAG: response regulator [Anaerolineales bacterium]|nr:response regulator [Chloroflexota bacterium]MBL6983963.1 response regulator [Anaerolineales bacterium]